MRHGSKVNSQSREGQVREPGLARSSWFKSGLRNGLALFDQALVSGTRFATTILVGRICGPSELGIYSLAITFLILISCLQQALIGQPYTVYSNRLEGRQKAMLAGSVLIHYLLISIFGMVVLSLGSLVVFMGVGPARLAPVLLVLAAVIPFSLLWELGRWFAFAHIKLAHAVALDFGVAVLQVGGLFIIGSQGWLTAATAYVMVGVGCGLVGLCWLFLTRKNFVINLRAVWLDWKKNWALGRWLAASQVMGVLNGQASVWMLALLVGSFATGLFVAGESIVLLSNPIILGIGNLLCGETAVAYARGGKAEVKRVTFRAAWLMLGSMVLLYLFLVFAADELIWLFYGEQYMEAGEFVAVLAICTFAWAVTAAVGKGLLAIERSDIVFRGTWVGLVVTVIFGLPMVSGAQTFGAAWALLIGSFACAAVQCSAFLWLVRESELDEVSAIQLDPSNPVEEDVTE